MSISIYATITVSGDDTLDFLQGQLTVDLRPLQAGERTLAAWCNPKGRVICLMRVAAGDAGFTLTLPAELAEAVLQRLTMYRFRSKVDFALREATADELGIVTDLDAWLLENLQAGRAEVWLDQSERFTPHMLNLDLLGAVSVDKGCYTGQEVVARTHYRGATKRRCLRFSASAPVSPGQKVSDGERDIGEIVNAIDTDFLAVVAVDKADGDLHVDGRPVTRVPLPYL